MYQGSSFACMRELDLSTPRLALITIFIDNALLKAHIFGSMSFL